MTTSIHSLETFSNQLSKIRSSLTHTDCQYRDGDKVIHLVNDAKAMSLMNIGYITIFKNIQARWIVINLIKRMKPSAPAQWMVQRLAYAMSIHKSQGLPVMILLPIKACCSVIWSIPAIRAQEQLILLENTAPLISLLKIQVLARKDLFDWTLQELDGGRSNHRPSSLAAAAQSNLHEARKTVETKAETSKPTVYRLTEDNHPHHLATYDWTNRRKKLQPSLISKKDDPSEQTSCLFFSTKRQFSMIDEILYLSVRFLEKCDALIVLLSISRWLRQVIQQSSAR